MGKKSKNKKKNANNNNNASQPRNNIGTEKSSLSSICDFLGGSDKKQELKPHSSSDKNKVKTIVEKPEEKKVKPIVSKNVPEEHVYRPSKEKSKTQKLLIRTTQHLLSLKNFHLWVALGRN